MSHKPYNGLSFTNSVPKFLQAAVAKHGIKQNSFLAKKFVSEDGNNDETDETGINRFVSINVLIFDRCKDIFIFFFCDY